jgi:HEAT repeat protein
VLACLGPEGDRRERLLDTLEDLLAGPEEDRSWAKAALALGSCGGAAARASILRRLQDLLRQPGEESIAAVWAVGQMGSRAATDSILERLAAHLGSHADAPAEITRLVCTRMGQTAFRRLLELLLGKLYSPNREERDAVLRAFCTLYVLAGNQPAVLDRVLQLLRDESADLRLTAVWAVESIGPSAMTQMIREALTDLTRDPDDRVAPAARRALADAAHTTGDEISAG